MQPAVPLSPREIAEKVMPSVVLLMMQDQNGQPLAMASGFVVSEGIVATNFHAIAGAGSIDVRLVEQKPNNDEQEKNLSELEKRLKDVFGRINMVNGVVASDPEHDLVLLEVDGLKAVQLPIADSEQAAIGDAVYVVGNPQGLEGTFSAGIVSGIRRIGEDSLLQITAPISPGSSGGPVLNSKGEVIGVAVATFKGGQNLNFAIPSKYLSALIGNKGTPKLLSEYSSEVLQEPSIVESMGNHAAEGVTGGDFIWQSDYSKDKIYSFSLRNHLRQDIRNVRYLVVFYNRRGEVIEALERKYGSREYPQFSKTIRAGLAARITEGVDISVRSLTTPDGSKTPDAKIEIRILDFEIVSPQTMEDEQ